MRRFLLADTDETLAIKVDKVKKSVREAEKDPLLQKTILRLEQAPVLTTDLNNGKGPVFDFGDKEIDRRNWDLNAKPTKLLADSMKANRNVLLSEAATRFNSGSNVEAEGSTWTHFLTVLRCFELGSLNLVLPGLLENGCRLGEGLHELKDSASC